MAEDRVEGDGGPTQEPAASMHFEEQVGVGELQNPAEKVELVDWDIDANRPAEKMVTPDLEVSYPAEIHERRQGLERELATLLNRHSEENESGTPDFILAGFLIGVLDAYNKTLGERAAWRGESVELPALQSLRKDVGEAERVFAVISKLRDQGIIQIDESVKGSDVYRTMKGEDLEQGGFEAGDTQAPIDLDEKVVVVPGALDKNDGKEVPLVIYTDGQRNEIGTAQLHVTPGEVHVTGTITGAIPQFEDMFQDLAAGSYSIEVDEPKDKQEDKSPLTPFQRYQQKGLSQNG